MHWDSNRGDMAWHGLAFSISLYNHLSLSIAMCKRNNNIFSTWSAQSRLDKISKF